ncbi:hypothetical protein ZIOFF_060042 [Zingiber officinale]|uniref:DUF659 domain-containing protein n=1 Tax=Zingiber officinale TaxID=94328 RepID=A0A8J5FA87_ZINOF|nr:hypothetical protein ZIOFF_060042 [Zingiber officinale]
MTWPANGVAKEGNGGGGRGGERGGDHVVGGCPEEERGGGGDTDAKEVKVRVGKGAIAVAKGEVGKLLEAFSSALIRVPSPGGDVASLCSFFCCANCGSSASIRTPLLEGKWRRSRLALKRKMMSDEEEGIGESNPYDSEKKLRDEACQQILRFFRTSGIPFSCAKNPELTKMFELVGKCGSEFVSPSYQKRGNSSLKKEMKNTIDMLEYKYDWKKPGCSIICDEWKNSKGSFFCNFLVNSPEVTIFMKSIDISGFSETTVKVFEVLDEIVEVVGEENVFQVITNNDANYKVAGKLLIEKRKRIFWSPCVVQLLDGILEDFENNLSHHHITIVKGKKISTFIYSRTIVVSMLRDFTKGKDWNVPTITPSATSYLTLLYLFDVRDTLIAIFSSEQWKLNELAKTKEGEEIQQIVQDCGFWRDIVYCLICALPIIDVLLKIYYDDKPTMGFIYKEMNRAEESLQSLNNLKGYETVCKILEERWNPLLHPQYIASHLLNPRLPYVSISKYPSESNEGPYAWLAKLIIDYDDDLTLVEADRLGMHMSREKMSLVSEEAG